MANIGEFNFAVKRLLTVGIVGAALAAGAGNAKAEALPSSTTSDWSYMLDSGWTCGQVTGPRWDQWKKSVLLFAASSGYGFKGTCNAIKEATSDAVRNGSVIVTFRDSNNITQYVGWYDAKFDRDRQAVFGGITPVTAETHYDVRYTPVQNHPLYTFEQRFAFFQFLTSRRVQPVAYHHLNDLFERNFTRVNGCVAPYSLCGTGTTSFYFSDGGATVNVGLEDPAGTRPYGRIYEYHHPKPDFLEKLVTVAITIGLTYYGGYIGESIGLIGGTASHAAFATGFGSFSSGLLQGQKVNEALLGGLKGAGLAYAGTMVLNQFGDPDALVGVKGAGCPTGDQCWYFQMANGLPPLKHLAELHDPFINWSVRAFGSIAENGWYKAVTIAPFVVPGCLASDACVAGGITIVREDEGR